VEKEGRKKQGVAKQEEKRRENDPRREIGGEKNWGYDLPSLSVGS